MCILQCLGYCLKSYVRVLTQSNTLTIAREKAAKALKEKGETPEELLRSIKENEAAVAEAQRTVDAWKAIVGEKSRREEAAKAEAERIATEKAEAERKAAEERERAEAEEEARVEAERKAEEERIAKQKAEEKTAEAESDKEETEKRMDDEEPKPLGSGVFGNIYNQFKGKVKEAFDFLMKHKGGDLLGVFHRKDVGDIDLVWGDHGGGLAHIIRRHIIEQNDFKNVDEIQKVIEDVIRNGLIVRENKDKINIEYNGYRVSIKKTIRDSKGSVVENKNWIVTAFDKSKSKHEKRNPSSSETLTTPSANQKADGVTLPSNEDSIDKGSEKPEKKQEKQSVFDKAKEIADKEEKKRKAEAEKQKVDKQGNPIDAEGRLITEKVEDISDLSDDDFNNPTRSVELPKIPKNVDDALGANGRPVIIKKNIFEKNGKSHGFTPEQSRKILGDALYNPDIVGQSQPSTKKTHWVAIKVDEKSPITILEVNDGKDNVEVVGWYTLDARNLERIKRQAEREGGELLVLSPKDKVESLPTPTSGLPTDKGSEVGGEKQEAEKKRPAPIAERIEDVGEKIGDARKDVWKEIIARIKNKKQGIEEALKKSSAGKLFSSLFDEKELLESGVSNEVVTFISAVKGSLGTKPRSLSKLKMWINKVLHQYDMCEQALENWESVKKKIDEWKYYSQPFYMYRAAMAVGGYESGRDVGNAELWQIADGYSDGKSVAGQWCVRKAGAYDGIYKTYEEAAEALKKFAGENAAVDGKGKRKEVKLAIYKRRTDGTMFIAPEGKPDVIIQDGFKTLYEASAYKKEHYAEMQERYRTLMDGIKPKFNENRERKGRDWRGGKDVSAEDFREAFDFRGVEFGNWMQQKDRRQALNECYDSLMDLAMVCGVSPKALSLGGKLAMAFGARGGGKFNAHYEPDKVVINLTKTKGAGSLAHEWFHAIDNYFNMQGWDEFATESTRNVERKEMAEAWKDLVRAINGSDYFKRSDKYARLKGSRYWIEPTELGARAFAVWVENRLSKYGTINDYLANNPRLVDEKASDAEKKYAPYPFDKDADWMDEKFGRLFEVMQERVDEETGKHILYSRNKAAGHEKTELTAEERELRDNLVERMRKGGLDVVTDSEEMQRVIDTENERTRMMGAGSVREHRVYHGSGADFDAFDHSHMGEGEGAQAYGWGTYVTEVEGIGKTYANATAHNYNKALRPLERKRDSIRNSLRIEALELDSARGGLRVAVKAKAKAEENYEEFLKRREEIEEKYGKHSTQYDDYLWNSPYAIAVRAIEHYENEIKERETELHSLQKDLEETRKQIENIAKEYPHHLYTVEIPDDNGSNYLDWNGHPAESLLKDVGSFLESNGFERVQDSPVRYEKGESTVVLNPNATGADLYAELREALGSDKKASQALAELGCIGIEYPADNMRGGRKDGAKNYVIFNENDAKITDHTRFLRTAGGEVYGLVKDGRIYLDPKVATAETAVHEYTHLWGDMLRRKDSEQWSRTVKELKNSVLWEEVKESYPELKTDDEIADEVLSTFSGRRGAERLREEARRVAESEGGVFTKAKAIETLERVKEAIARFWEGVARMFGINRYRSAEELADMAMKDLLDGVDPRKVGNNEKGIGFSAKQKRALETVTMADKSTNKATAISSADGAKVQNNLEILAESYNNRSNKTKGFITDLSQALNLERHEASHYGTFETQKGKLVTIRVSNHNARVSLFDKNGENDGISIVISNHKNKGLLNDGNAHIIEFFYSKQSLQRADGKPLSDIIRSVSEVLYSGEFKDTTGLAERQEVNGDDVIRFQFIGEKGAAEADHAEEVFANENVERSVRENRSEKTELTAEERELRDNLVERMRKGGLDVVTDSEEMQRVIDTENERTRMMGAGSVREHRVYHGSGADFDAFDHSHMGEGEGAQAYGWGTYVTEVEGIGRTYAIQNTTKHNDALRALQHDVDAISDQLDRLRDDLKYNEEQLKRANEWRAEAELDYELFKDEAEKLKEKYGEASPKYRNHLFNDIYTDEMKRAQSSVKSTEESIQYRKEKIAELEKALKDKQAEIDELPKEFPRHLYTVEIPDDNGRNYLDWNGHPAESLLKDVGSFLESNGFERVQDSPVRYEKGESTVVLNPNATGADLYAELREALGSDKKASQALAELGCIGIEYPADNMRGGRKDGAKNYVIFNENDAKITDHTRFLRTAGGEVYGLVKDGRIYLDPKVATAETAVHEYTHLWGDMLRRKDSEQWSRTVKELKNSVLWEEVKESYPELKTDDEIADEVLSTFSGRRGAERLREEARRVAESEGGVFTKAKAIETLERVKEAIARFWEGVARMFGINRYRSAEELADMAMKDLLDSKNPMKDESGMRKRGEVGETLATSGTYFSGGGLLEAGLKGVIDPKVAVEFSEKIAGVYADNHGNHIVVADVRDVDPKKLVGAVDGGEVQYFHASPVCKNFSKAKREGGEVELDKETALSTAEFIAKTRPKVVTIENVKGYRNSEALKIITDELTRQGYDWDADVYNAADYGGYTKRERLIVRAKRDGKLPPKPEKLPEELRKKGWYSAVEDLIPHLEEKKTGVPQGTDERLKNSGIDYRTIDKPLYVFGRGYANKTVGHAFADELLPTLTTGGGDIIIMPDGRVLKASPRVLARVTGLPDTYKMPETDQLSHTIVGNGIPTQLTEGVIAPLLDNAIPSAERATKRESVFDVADRVSQNLEERTRAMGSRVEKRMADVAQKLEGKELSMEQKAVVDVFSGEKDNQKFSVERNGVKQQFLLKQGQEDKAGAKHSLYRHYGTNTGVITADDVLKIPQVLERGERIEKAKGGKKMAVYTMDIDGVKYTVLTRVGKNNEIVDDFYSNKKGSESSVYRNVENIDNTPEGARRKDSEPSAKVEDKSESPKLFGEEIIDDGKKGSDSIDRSVRENPKNEDKPRYSRKPGESIFDYASRVSEDVDRSVREIVSARDEYEKKVKSKGFQTKEALQNSMLGLQEFMSAIDHASGNKRYIEDIPDFENPILGENRLSSVNKEEMHQVAKTQFKPLMSAVAKLSGNGKESGELYDYMFAKHGLERDAVMRQREAQKDFDKYQKANPKGTKTIGDFVASLEGKDYAGLTALTAEDGRVKSIQSQIDAIDEQMKATDDQLLLRKLGGQKKRLKVDLLNAARDAADDIRKTFENNPSHDRSDINELWSRVNEVNGNTLRKLYESGMLTKEAYNDISSMYTNYIPMRGFDQTTSADAYAYLTHGDSAFNAPIKTAKGRSSKADNPIAYMQAMAESAIMQGNRNVLVKQKMLNFVRNHPSDLASVSDVWLQYDSVADEWKPFYGFGRESKG